MNKLSFGCAMAAASLSCLVATPATAQEKGELWDTTAQAVVEGSPMKMPIVSGKHCAKKDWTEAPASGDPSQHCQNKDFKRSGNTVTWSVACENPPMTGKGELEFSSPDAYTGVLHFNTGDHQMQVQMTGKKVGSCDNPQ